MSTLINLPDSFENTLGYVDLPNKAAWRRAHFLGGSAEASRVNRAQGGANPLGIVGAPTYTPGYAITTVNDGFAAPDATDQFNRTSVVVMSTPWAPNTPEFQGATYKPAAGTGTPAQNYADPAAAADLANWPALWFSNRFEGIFSGHGWTAAPQGSADSMYPGKADDTGYRYPFPPAATQRPDGTIAPPKTFFALYLTTDIARGKAVFHATQGYSILRMETALGGDVPPAQRLHVAGRGGGNGVAKAAVAFVGEMAAQPDAIIANINDWLWAELAVVGVER